MVTKRRDVNGTGVTTTTHEIEWRGRGRRFHVVRPVAASSKVALPVVVVLHGGFGTGSGQITHGRWLPAAVRHGFVLLAPDGFRRTWNAGTCCGPARRHGIDDVGFLDVAVDVTADITVIDRTRVFASGMSNGGMMAYRWACESRHAVRAIAPVAATMCAPPGVAPGRPVSLLHIHGTHDHNVPLEGGRGSRAVDRSGPRPPVRTGVELFARNNGCDPDPVVDEQGPVTPTRGRHGRDGTEVELVVVAGGGHAWPGGERMHRRLDPPSHALDATERIAGFFLRP